MEARELRLGNWIKHNRFSSRSHSAEPFQAQINDIASASLCEPIPLTPEWLERLGFVEPDKGYEREFFDKYGRCVVRENKRDNSIFYWGDVKIQYVHQLQNLYYSLTGEELTVKP